MVVGRRHRRALAGWLILALLFMQCAVAAYACPRTAADPASLASMDDMPGCEGMAAGMDLEQPQLCKAHCERDAQTVNAFSAIDLPAATSMPAVLDWAPPVLAGPAAARQRALPSGIPPPGSPPLYLALLVLRR